MAREKSLTPPEPVKPQEELPVVPSFTILTETSKFGRPLYTVTCLLIQGEKVVKTVPLPEGTYNTVRDAVEDVRRCLSKTFIYGQLDALLAGKRGV